MKTSTCFKGSYSLIVLYSRTVMNYFESKSDIYSLLSLNIFYCLISTKGLGYKFLQH